MQAMLIRVLFIWAIRHPASSYVQGINDLCAPVLLVFLSEYVFKADKREEALHHSSVQRGSTHSSIVLQVSQSVGRISLGTPHQEVKAANIQIDES